MKPSSLNAPNRRILLAGWFSFEGMGTTAGDLLSRDTVISWLRGAGIAHDVASVPLFGCGFDWRSINPCVYTHVLFVCGPFGNGPPLVEFLDRFRHCRLIGLNLSMLQSLEEWNPFEVLFERDSTRSARPDLAFLHHSEPRSVAGLILIHEQPEYRNRDLHALANRVLKEVLDAFKIVAIPIDTCLEGNAGQLTTASQVEALISRMDLVATTRLHGLVLALKNAVPALVIDSVSGGGKVHRQAETLGWPAVVKVDALTNEGLSELCAYCMTADARDKARECGRRARESLHGLSGALIECLSASNGSKAGTVS